MMGRKEGKEPMVIKSISIDKDLWEQALEKARQNAQSFSAVIRRLVQKWLAGEIDLDWCRILDGFQPFL